MNYIDIISKLNGTGETTFRDGLALSCNTKTKITVTGKTGFQCEPFAVKNKLLTKYGDDIPVWDGNELYSTVNGKKFVYKANEPTVPTRSVTEAGNVQVTLQTKHLEHVLRAVPKDAYREALMQMQVTKDAIVGTDSYRLHWVETETGLENDSILIDRGLVEAVLKLKLQEVTFEQNKYDTWFDVNDIRVSGPSCQYNYPNWRSLIPLVTRSMPIPELKDYIDLYNMDKSNPYPVVFYIEDGICELSLKNDCGTMSETFPVKLENTKVAYNPVYLAETRGNTISFNGTDKPARIGYSDHCMHAILMSVRLG